MSDTVIKIEGLGKKYLLAHKIPQHYIALRDVLMDRARRLGQRLSHPLTKAAGEADPTREEFWALKDVSFDVHQGDRVGIVGRNGAGKSTLLKLLSRITEPSTGRISLRGRMASLLEVGTGFHPELTGRENIYMSGAVLGMTRSEIQKNFDAIVDFAGVEKFLDTPVKRYSSGMYVRLAFAVAAHLETEILMIDEILAVGDAEFQKRCLGKMDEVSHKEGRTILFVSHNMGAITQLCSRVVCLDKGHVVVDTPSVAEGVKQYLSASRAETSLSEWKNPGNLFENPYFKPLRFGLYGEDGKPLNGPATRKDNVFVEIEGVVEKPDVALSTGYALYAGNGALLYWNYQTDQMGSSNELPILRDRACIRQKLPLNILNTEEEYTLELIVSLYCQEWFTQPERGAPSVSFKLEGAISSSPYCLIKRPGYLAVDAPWSLN